MIEPGNTTRPLRSLLVLDTETTASGGIPHLIELAALLVVDGEAVDSFETLVRAEVPIDPASEAIHGIATEDLADAPPTAEVLSAFAAWAEKPRDEIPDPEETMGWAHAARADARVLAYECARHGISPPGFALVDGLAVSRKLFGDLIHHDLASLVEHFTIEWEPQHRALSDSAAAWQVAEYCIERLGGWGVATRAALLASAGSATSIPAAAPIPPRRHRAHARRIEAARQMGVDVELLYAAEGGAAARLVVAPRLLYQHKEKAYLEGECRASGLWKTYRLDRVRRAIPLEGTRQAP